MYTEKNLVALLKTLGIPFGLKGYKLIKEAVIILHKNGGYFPTGELMTLAGEKFDSTYSQAVRCIREAIRQSVVNTDSDTLRLVFGNSIYPILSKKPMIKPADYISGLYEYLTYHDVEKEIAEGLI